eukprot:TRINITY_DN3543_c0_g1_i1.p1 TRINITY_DN3543_c0_g1~~TRINITY_DN3543_c0_g1_i1.p1  ORF type:complete len:395 (+),score=128.74 TRINITY_DN3543_c0_g1_i1:117-1301(+)
MMMMMTVEEEEEEVVVPAPSSAAVHSVFAQCITTHDGGHAFWSVPSYGVVGECATTSAVPVQPFTQQQTTHTQPATSSWSPFPSTQWPSSASMFPSTQQQQQQHSVIHQQCPSFGGTGMSGITTPAMSTGSATSALWTASPFGTPSYPFNNQVASSMPVSPFASSTPMMSSQQQTTHQGFTQQHTPFNVGTATTHTGSSFFATRTPTTTTATTPITLPLHTPTYHQAGSASPISSTASSSQTRKRKAQREAHMDLLTDNNIHNNNNNNHNVTSTREVNTVSKRMKLLQFSSSSSSSSSSTPSTPSPSSETIGSYSFQVKTLTGRTITVNMRLDDSIAIVKELIEEKSGIPVSQQRLIYGGKQMADTKTLREYRVPPGGLLHLVLALRGGGGAGV